MGSAAWIDGVVTGKLEAAVSPFDHGVLFGDGLKLGVRLAGGWPVRLAASYAVLAEVARAVSIKLPWAADQLAAALAELARVAGRQDGYYVVLVTRGAGMVGLDPRKCEPRGVILLDDLLPYPPELLTVGVQVVTARGVTRRPGVLADTGLLLADAVGTSAVCEALASGCLDAVVLTTDGLPSGTTGGALFGVRGDTLLTMPRDVSPEPVAYDAVCELASHRGLTPTPWQNFDATDEYFFAASGYGVVPISHWNNQAVATPSRSLAIQADFFSSH